MYSNYKFRLYCNDENDYVYTSNYTGIEPTICPNNPLHILNTSLTCIVETITTDKILSIHIENPIINNDVFNRIAVYNFPEFKLVGAKIISYMDNTGTSYSIKIVNNNNEIMLNQTLNNTTESVQDLGILTNLSSSYIEIFAKKLGGDVNTKVYIKNLLIYYI